MNGWIKLYRSIQDNPIYFDKQFCRGMAWIDLLLNANHDDKKILFDGNVITIKRGQFLTSIRKLKDRWGWSTTKIYKFLKELKKEQMLNIESDNKKTLITLINYDVYQGFENTEKTQNEHRTNTEKSQKKTNNNIKNDKNDKEDIFISDQSKILNELNEQNILNHFQKLHQVYFFIDRIPLHDILNYIQKCKDKPVEYLVTVLKNHSKQKTFKGSKKPILQISNSTEQVEPENMEEALKLARILDGG